MQKANHVYLVFNPLLNEDSIYQSQAHEFYYRLKEKLASGEVQDSFMYWGKLSVAESHEDDIQKINDIIKTNSELGEDTHLYITDYHHFWVGKLSSASGSISNKDHTLAFYDNKEVGMWLKVSDFDLVSSDFNETMTYLQQLYCDNQFIEEKIDRITPYISGVHFPLIVQDHTVEKYFKQHDQSYQRVSETNPLIETPKLASEVYHQVKSFVLRPETYKRLSHTVKDNLFKAEARLVHQGGDPKDVLTDVLHSYLRIFDSVMTSSLGSLLRDELGHCVYIGKDGTKITDVSTDDNILLSEYDGIVTSYAYVDLYYHANDFGNISFDSIKNKYPEAFNFFLTEVIPFVEEFEIKGKLVSLFQGENLHVNKSEVMAIRNTVLGIGSYGMLNKLIELFLYSDSYYGQLSRRSA